MTDQATFGRSLPLWSRERQSSGPDRVDLAIQAEERSGFRLAMQARLIALLVVGIWLPFVLGAAAIFDQLLLLVFAAFGYLNYVLISRDSYRPWQSYLLLALDAALLTYAVIVPNPMMETPFPVQTMFRHGNFVYFFIFVALVSLSYSPKLVIWMGVASGLIWGIATTIVFFLPDTIAWQRLDISFDTITYDEALEIFLKPTFLDINPRIQEAIVILLVSGILATVVWRSRRLVLRQANASRERANLTRYFPPTIVEQLARMDEPLGTVREQPVAILFADIVGFTRLSQHQDPERVVAFLRDFHGRLEKAVFDHSGTLDKFLGDGVMATFGTPHTGARDAADAIACAKAMLASMADWNGERAAAGLPPVRLSIGIHYGKVVLGDIGSERRLEFAVVGDAVNVASRLESLTRDLNCEMLISADCADAATQQTGDEAAELLADFTPLPPQSLRGWHGKIAVWRYGSLAADL